MVDVVNILWWKKTFFFVFDSEELVKRTQQLWMLKRLNTFLFLTKFFYGIKPTKNKNKYFFELVTLTLTRVLRKLRKNIIPHSGVNYIIGKFFWIPVHVRVKYILVLICFGRNTNVVNTKWDI